LGDVRCGHRADLAVTDVAATVDDIGLGHPVNSEIDRGDTVAIEADAAKRVTETIKEATRILGFVFVGDAVEGDAGAPRQRHQLPMLFATGGAPRGEEIDERHPAVEVFPR